MEPVAQPTILGMTVPALVNQLQNVALVVLTFFGTRAHLSADTQGMIISTLGVVLTMGANAFTHVAAGQSLPTAIVGAIAAQMSGAASSAVNGAQASR